MIEVPGWLDGIVREFSEGMGLRDFSLNGDGAAAVRFENGTEFRLEYAMGALVLSMSAVSPADAEAAKILLSAADPLRRGTFLIRSGLLGDPPRAVFAVKLESADITLGNLDAAMAELWRAAENHRRRVGS